MPSISAWLYLFSILFATPALAVDVYRGVTLPPQIAGFKRSAVIDNEATSPGFGMTIAYGAPGIKATVFVYDLSIRGLPEGTDNATVRAQARQALQDIVTAHPDAQVLEALAPGQKSCGKFLRAKVSYLEARNSEAELLHSFLYFGSRMGNFVKVRLSYAAKADSANGAVLESRFTEALCAAISQ